MEINCPQCGELLGSPSARLVQDSCGHKKCRMCLLQDESECRMCFQKDVVESSNFPKGGSTVIKYENNHAAVITCNTSVVKSTEQMEDSTKPENDHDQREQKCMNQTNKEIRLNNKKDSLSSKSLKANITGRKRTYKFINLPSHVSIFTDNPVTYKCNICTRTFRTKSHVKYHIYCAGDQKPLRCEECNKEFISKYHYQTHRLTHLDKKSYTCNICHKSFRHYGTLNRHKVVHLESKQFVCQQCGKMFKSKDYLQRHVLIHKEDKPYNCTQCNAKFNNRSNFNKHKTKHTKEKIHMCDECGKRYKLKNALTAHRRSHTQLRPHKCTDCSKTFINLKELRRHQLIHLDMKAYACSLCGVCFRRKDNLQRHIKNTHPGRKATVIKKPIMKSSVRSNKPIQCEALTESPNAIKVITAPPACPLVVTKEEPILSKPVPVINAPLKLAVKNNAFKSYYNIHSREYIEPPRIHPKPYDYAESVSICQKILSPSSPPPSRTIIKTLGNVSEQESTKICQKILSPIVPPVNNETTFERPYSVTKFKLPSKYVNLSKRNILNDICPLIPTENVPKIVNSEKERTYTELRTLTQTNAATSVIVNSHSTPQIEMHWRRRTLQNLETLSKQTDS